MDLGCADADQPPGLTDDEAPSTTEPIGRCRRAWAWVSGHAGGLLVITGYLALGVLLTSGQWRRPDRLFHQESDQVLFEWMLAWAARVVTNLEHPFYTESLGAPDGVNLMANTSVLGLGVPLAPVTLVFGSQVAFLVAVIAGLAGTATAWYLLLRRRLVRSRSAAAIGGLVCGFAPGMVSQGSAHLHMSAQFLVPAILAVVFDSRTDRVPYRGVLLGLLVTGQVFIGEEVLFFLVVAAGVATLGYTLAAPATARRLAPAFLGRIGVGAVTALVLLAYPLWFQFFGPGHYRGLPFNSHAYVLDLASFITPAHQVISGDVTAPGRWAPNRTEENSFYGVALLALTAVVVGWLWRRPLVRALTACGLLFGLLSLGTSVRLFGEKTGLPGPYRLIADWPLFDLAVPARFALICTPVIAILLAFSLDEVYRRWPPESTPAVPVRMLWTGAVLAVLLPLAPTPIRTEPFWPVPAFIASGEWRAYVPAGRTVVPVLPTTGHESVTGMYWSARTGVPFTAPGGYYIGPRAGEDDPSARWGAPDRPTAVLLERVARTGQVPAITDVERQQALEDLRHWHAAIVVQGGLHRGYPVKQTLDALLGPAQGISGAWVWDVRDRVR